jgi:hypothetical protein
MFVDDIYYCWVFNVWFLIHYNKRGFHCDNLNKFPLSLVFPFPLSLIPPIPNSIWWISLCCLHMYIFVFLFLLRLGFELRASHLQSRHCTCLSHTSSHFALVVLKMWSRGLFAWLTSEETLLISASQVARITGVSLWCPAHIYNFIISHLYKNSYLKTEADLYWHLLLLPYFTDENWYSKEWVCPLGVHCLAHGKYLIPLQIWVALQCQPGLLSTLRRSKLTNGYFSYCFLPKPRADQLLVFQFSFIILLQWDLIHGFQTLLLFANLSH